MVSSTQFWISLSLAGGMMLAGCRDFLDASRSVLPEVHEVRRPVLPAEPEALGRLHNLGRACVRTRGDWKPLLATCTCPPYSVYYANRGCAAFTKPESATDKTCRGHATSLDRTELQQCIERLLSTPTVYVLLELQSLANSDIASIAQSLATDPTRLLDGFAFPVADDASVSLKLMKMNNVSASTLLMPWMASPQPGAGITAHIDPGANMGPPTDLQQFSARCWSALNIAAPAREAVHQRLCDSASALLQSIYDGASNTNLVATFTEEGANCNPECALVINKRGSASPAVYNMVMSRYAPLARYVVTAEGDDDFLFVFVAPHGAVQSIAHAGSRIAAQAEPHLLETTVTLWARDWQPIGVRLTTRGDRAALARALSHVGTTRTPLPTDGKQRPILARISAAIIDSGINISAQPLRERVAINESAARNFVQQGIAARSLMSNDKGPVGNALDMLGEHGAAMASIVAADLPNIAISAIRVDMSVSGGDPAAVAQAWGDQIRQSGARVVNISQVFSRRTAMCEELFGKLFDALPDVLFVAGMGNAGGQDPTGACPVGVAFGRSNVLTVAGVQPSGLLDESSNFGAAAMVAAPFDADVIDTRPHGLLPLGTRVESGTSVSTALVSNAALRLIARFPDLTPREVIGALMAHCRADGIDVQCDGAIDFAGLEEWFPAGFGI